jgi:hypothetical protein
MNTMTDKETTGQKIARDWCARWRPTILPELPDAAQIELARAIDSAVAEAYAAGITSVEELYEEIRKAGDDAVKKP